MNLHMDPLRKLVLRELPTPTVLAKVARMLPRLTWLSHSKFPPPRSWRMILSKTSSIKQASSSHTTGNLMESTKNFSKTIRVPAYISYLLERILRYLRVVRLKKSQTTSVLHARPCRCDFSSSQELLRKSMRKIGRTYGKLP